MSIRPLLAAALAAALAAVVLVPAGCGGSGDSPGGAAGASANAAGGHGEDHGAGAATAASGMLVPPAPAPELGLRDHLGRRVTTGQFQGKAMLVTFVYSRCPDVCPLIVANLRRVLDRLGPRARDVAVVAVSVDPRGDTRRNVTAFLRRQGMAGRMLWLVGTRRELEPVWDRWGIATRIPRDNPELVEHAAPVYGVDASGRIAKVYPLQFTPREIAEDIAELVGA